MLWILCLILIVWAVPAQAATYYARPGGSDASCSAATNPATPRNSAVKGASCLSAGDTLVLGGGTYAEVLDQAIPSGTAGSRTIVKNAPGEKPVLRPSGTGSSQPAVITIWAQHYITIDGLTIDLSASGDAWCGNLGGSCLSGSGGFCCLNYGFSIRENHDVTVQKTEILNAPTRTSSGAVTYGVGISVNEDTSNILLQDNLVHDLCYTGEPEHGQGYGFYFKGTNNIARRNRLYNLGSHGFHIYNQRIVNIDMQVVDNTIYNTRLSGILVGASSNALVANNLIYNCSLGFSDHTYMAGIVLGYGGSGTKVINNTVHGCRAGVVTVRAGEQTGALIRGNIGHNNAHNGVTAGPTDTVEPNFFGDPRFVDAPRGDFHLQDGSPASGFCKVHPDVTMDKDDRRRGQGVGTPTAAGAYEAGKGGAVSGGRPTPIHLRAVTVPPRR
jgi:parallel beta-helix repeat protein